MDFPVFIIIIIIDIKNIKWNVCFLCRNNKFRINYSLQKSMSVKIRCANSIDTHYRRSDKTTLEKKHDFH